MGLNGFLKWRGRKKKREESIWEYILKDVWFSHPGPPKELESQSVKPRDHSSGHRASGPPFPEDPEPNTNTNTKKTKHLMIRNFNCGFCSYHHTSRRFKLTKRSWHLFGFSVLAVHVPAKKLEDQFPRIDTAQFPKLNIKTSTPRTSITSLGVHILNILD